MEKIGKYEIIKTLGKGATAVVYLANDPDRGHPVAVKLIRFNDDNAAMSRRLRKLFQTEGATGRRLQSRTCPRMARPSRSADGGGHVGGQLQPSVQTPPRQASST